MQGRITPAYAGSRFPSSPPCFVFEDHPRVCGEQMGFLSPTSFISGSPPRMRGAGLSMNIGSSVNRITPAYAGSRIAKV